MKIAENRTTNIVADPTLIEDWSPSGRRIGHSSPEVVYPVTKI